MQNVLINVIEKGTGKKAITQGIIAGGKTGTARIAERQGYTSNRYNASFFGFANDLNHAYTIGVLVRHPTNLIVIMLHKVLCLCLKMLLIF